MTDILSEIEDEIKNLGGNWTAYIIRSLWQHPDGLSRETAIDIVLEDALARGLRTPKTFRRIIQNTFLKHQVTSCVCCSKAERGLFHLLGSKRDGVWGLNRSEALAWMATNGRACDFVLKPKNN